MKTTSKIIAAAVVALGASAFSVPASADFGDFGQHVYTEQSQSRFAPNGIATKPAADRQTVKDSRRADRYSLFNRIDRAHNAY